MIMDFIQPGTNLGMFLQIIASLKTVPPRMFRIVPLGDFHIFFKLNSESQINNKMSATYFRLNFVWWNNYC